MTRKTKKEIAEEEFVILINASKEGKLPDIVEAIKNEITKEKD